MSNIFVEGNWNTRELFEGIFGMMLLTLNQKKKYFSVIIQRYK